MRYLKYFKESTSYLNLHGDDDYEITQVIQDNNHEYKYCDGVMYEISGETEMVYIEQVETTPGNTFYEEQIERYIEYINNGGIIETFPVNVSNLCNNLECMFEYLDESDNFDTTYSILKDTHEKLFNIFMKKGLYDINIDPEEYGFSGDVLSNIRTETDLAEYYASNNENYDEELYNSFIAILEWFEDEKEYTLTNLNHRFEALVRMGKKQVLVEI